VRGRVRPRVPRNAMPWRSRRSNFDPTPLTDGIELSHDTLPRLPKRSSKRFRVIRGAMTSSRDGRLRCRVHAIVAHGHCRARGHVPSDGQVDAHGSIARGLGRRLAEADRAADRSRDSRGSWLVIVRGPHANSMRACNVRSAPELTVHCKRIDRTDRSPFVGSTLYENPAFVNAAAKTAGAR
jgi:hypothetical protein